MPGGPRPTGDLAVSIQPVDDLLDHSHEQVLIAARPHVPLGPGMRWPARDDRETVHQAMSCLSDAFFAGRPPRLDTQVYRVRGRAMPATGPLARSGDPVRDAHRDSSKAPRRAAQSPRSRHAAHDPAVTIAGAGPGRQGPWSRLRPRRSSVLPRPAGTPSGAATAARSAAPPTAVGNGTTELTERVRRLEGQMAAVAEAVEVLTPGLESSPMAGPPNRHIEEAARWAPELLLLAKSAARGAGPAEGNTST